MRRCKYAGGVHPRPSHFLVLALGAALVWGQSLAWQPYLGLAVMVPGV